MAGEAAAIASTAARGAGAPRRRNYARRYWWFVVPCGVVVLGTIVFMLRTKWSPLWPIAVGAAAGILGWV